MMHVRFVEQPSKAEDHLAKEQRMGFFSFFRRKPLTAEEQRKRAIKAFYIEALDGAIAGMQVKVGLGLMPSEGDDFGTPQAQAEGQARRKTLKNFNMQEAELAEILSE